MAILQITNAPTGLVGVTPSSAWIKTNDTLATITETGYLTEAVTSRILEVDASSIVYISTLTAGVEKSYVGNVIITGTVPNLQYSFERLVGATYHAITSAPITVASPPESVLTLSVPAGVWLIWGNVTITSSASDISGFQAAITTDATSIGDPGTYSTLTTGTSTTEFVSYGFNVPMYPIFETAPTNYYMVVGYQHSGTPTVTALAQIFALQIG
jgi:hypothetical protein